MPFGLPDPPSFLNPFSDAVGAGKEIAGGVAAAIVKALAGAVDEVGRNLLAFLQGQTSINLSGGWWTSGRTDALLREILVMSQWLMLAAVLLAVMQGVFRGSPGVALKAVTVDVVVSVLGMVLVASVVQVLAAAVDDVSNRILEGVPGDVGHFLVTGGGRLSNIATSGVLDAVFVVLFLVASIVLWLELIMRSLAIYVLLGLSPLALAARVWPAMAGLWRRWIEAIVVLVFSKLVIAAVVGLGAAALAGGGVMSGPVGANVSSALSATAVGVVMLVLACILPVMLFRLVPHMDGALWGSEARRAVGSKVTSAALTANAVSSMAGRAGAGAAAATEPMSGGSAGSGGASSPSTASTLGGDAAAPPAGSGEPLGAALAGGLGTPPAPSLDPLTEQGGTDG